jgi:putative transposase
MECPYCQSSTTTERPENTTRGYRRFRCRTCTRGFNERTGSLFNRVHYPPDVVCLVVRWRVRYKLSLRDLAELFLERGLVFTHEAVREGESKLAPVLSETLRKHRRGGSGIQVMLASKRESITLRISRAFMQHAMGGALPV